MLLTFTSGLRGPRAPAVVDYEATVLVWAASKDENQAQFCEQYELVPLPDAGPAKGKAGKKASKSQTSRSQPHVISDPSSDEDEMALVPAHTRGASQAWSPSQVPTPHQMPTKRARFELKPPSPIHALPVVTGVKRKAQGDDHYNTIGATSSHRPQKALPVRLPTRQDPSRDSNQNPGPKYPSREPDQMSHPDRAVSLSRYPQPAPHSRPQIPYDDHNGYHHGGVPEFIDHPGWNPLNPDRPIGQQYNYNNHLRQPSGYESEQYIPRPRNHQQGGHEQYPHPAEPYPTNHQFYR